MRYKPRSVDALQVALGGLPREMRVEVDPDIEVSAKTVGELCRLTTWPHNRAITTPDGDRERPVRVSRASVATRVSPKP